MTVKLLGKIEVQLAIASNDSGSIRLPIGEGNDHRIVALAKAKYPAAPGVGSARSAKRIMTKGSQFTSLGLVLPLAVFAFLAHQGSCRGNANKATENQVQTEENTPQAGTAVREGSWGGLHIGMEVARKSTAIEFDCAHGMISEQLVLDRQGRFRARGTYAREHGGPVREGETPVSHPATYSGNIRGKAMTLTVTLTDSSESIGTFTLTQGSEGQVFKCR